MNSGLLSSHPNEHRDHHRRLVGAHEEEAGHHISEIVLHIVEVDGVHIARGVLNGLLDKDTRLIQEIL